MTTAIFSAVFAVTLCATSAQAGYFLIDGSQSWLGINGTAFQGANPDGSFNGPLLLGTPQNAGLNNGAIIPVGSLNAQINGYMYANVVPGSSIQFFNLGYAEIFTKTTGNYQPGENPDGTLPQFGPPAQPGNYGLKLIATAGLEHIRDSFYQSPVSLDPTLTIPQALATDGSGFFSATGVELLQTYGTRDITSGINSPSKTFLGGSNLPVNGRMDFNPVTGAPQSAFVSDTGNVNPVTLHLVLPVNYTQFVPEIINGTLIGYNVYALNGQIVADPTLVPEPTSIVLATFAVASLGALAMRKRPKRRSR